MVKSRQARVKANPLPNRFSIRATDAGISSIQKLAKAGAGGLTSDSAEDVNPLATSRNAATHGGSSAQNNNISAHKRPIFPHLTRLQHGILRYRNIAESPTSVANVFSAENDRRFVFVPAGYSLQNDQSMREVLGALQLGKLPPLVIVAAATDGAVDENMEEEDRPKFPKLAPPSNLDHLSEEEERELLKEKTQEILKSTVELCGDMGGWILPHRPRRANGAAEILCSVIKESNYTSSGAAKQAVILGMLGLDKQDHEEGFTAKIKDHMVPLGSEVGAIADVPFDPSLKDHIPCPELTHLLLFQRRQEMRAFRERLLAQTPDVFLAFGSTTPYAKKCLFSTVVTKSPIALVTHTSPEINHMSWMLRHADREGQKIQVGEADPIPLGTATYAVSGAATTFATQPLAPLQDLEAADPELSALLSMWPAGHDDERIVLADPRKVSGVQFQNMLLRAVNAAFYIRGARVIAIQEATNVLESIQMAAEEVKEVTERFHLGMVMATLTAVASAVMYAKIYGQDPAPSFQNRNAYQIALFLVTTATPLLILYLKKLYDEHSQLWSQIQKEAANLEATVAFFRTRPSSYGQQNASSGQEPLDAFVTDVCKIYSRALSSDEEILLESNAPSQGYDVEAPPPSESSPLVAWNESDPEILAPSPPKRLEDLAIRGSTSKWKKSYTAPAIDDGSMSSSQDRGIYGDKTQYLAVDVYQKQDSGKSDTSNESEEERPSGEHDNRVIWTIEEYIDGRIDVVRGQKEAELGVLEQRHHAIELIIKVILVSTTLMALLSKQWAIPIVLACFAAFVSSQDFRKYRTRVDHGESMIGELDELLSWWEGLTIEDKIMASNEDRLVQTAERIIAADVAFTY